MIHNSFASSGTTWVAPVVYTNGSYASTQIGYANPTTGVNPAGASSTFSLTDVGGTTNNVSYRLVGAGIRVRYMGTELNRGGRILPYRTRMNDPFISTVAGAVLLSDPQFITSPTSRTWHGVTYFPAKSTDMSYSNYNVPTTTRGGANALPTDNYYIMGCIIDGAPATQPFEFEAVAHFEVIQQNEYASSGQGGMTTKSHNDPVGFGGIISSIPAVFRDAGSSLASALKVGALNAIKYAASGVGTYVGRALGGMAGGPVGSIAGGAVAGYLTNGGGPTVEEV